MFYFKELFFRFKYSFLSFSLTFLITYFYKDIIFLILTVPLLDLFINFPDFIYTNPTELLTIHFLLMLLTSVALQLPYFSWHFLDFIKTSLLKNEYFKLIKLLFFLYIIIIVFNLIFFFIIFPKLWSFFYYFNFTQEPQTISFFLELRVQDYFKFVLDFISTINFFILLFYILFIFILFFGFQKLLYWKKLFLFINLVFATLLSPPDVYSQIVILFVLTSFLEVIIFISLFLYQLQNKLININKASY
jgi:sec-independent protein translocase protein TatC